MKPSQPSFNPKKKFPSSHAVPHPGVDVGARQAFNTLASNGKVSRQDVRNALGSKQMRLGCALGRLRRSPQGKP